MTRCQNGGKTGMMAVTRTYKRRERIMLWTCLWQKTHYDCNHFENNTTIAVHIIFTKIVLPSVAPKQAFTKLVSF